MRNRSSLLERLSSPHLLFFQVGKILEEGISIRLCSSSLVSKKFERLSLCALCLQDSAKPMEKFKSPPQNELVLLKDVRF